MRWVDERRRLEGRTRAGGGEEETKKLSAALETAHSR